MHGAIEVKGDPMAWWGWLLAGWIVAACAVGLWLALAIQLAEKREWLRRGSADRRQRPRDPRPNTDLATTPTVARRG